MITTKYCEKRMEECQQKVDAIQKEIDTLEDTIRRGTDPIYRGRPLTTGERMTLEHYITDLRHQLHTAHQQLEGWDIARTVSLH